MTNKVSQTKFCVIVLQNWYWCVNL